MFSLLSKILLVLGVLAGAYFGVTKAVAKMLLKNPGVQRRRTQRGDRWRAATRTGAARRRPAQRGKHFLLNLSRAKARVEAIPEVEKVQVTRQLPNRISIQINERKPVAWIASGHGPAPVSTWPIAKDIYFIDARGILLQPRKSLRRTLICR